MKERPILFSGPMVMAILNGKKSQTRRVISWPAWIKDGDKLKLAAQNPVTGLAYYEDGRPIKRFTRPYGVPGDLLWVRETFYVQPELWMINHGPQPIHYAADCKRDEVEDYISKPSIFMPRWASRITLEVVSARTQRIQDISEEEAKAEGCVQRTYRDGRGTETARRDFRHLWDSINAKQGFGWEADPWVWAIEFRNVSNQQE